VCHQKRELDTPDSIQHTYVSAPLHPFSWVRCIFFAQLSSYKLESSLQVMKILALLMLKQAGGAKKASHPIHFHLVFAICLLYSTVVTRLRVD
jgi:hypothetical protein